MTTSSLRLEDESSRRLRVGHTIREARLRQCLAQADIAYLLAVSDVFVTLIESGKRSLPAHHIPLLSLALEIPEEKLR